MAREKYFKPVEGAPPPLVNDIKRKVRFDELDPLNIMWHGHYASYFEEARVALGDRYGMGYAEFADNDTSIPLRKLHADYRAPLLFGKTYTVRAILHFTHAARLDFEYQILDENNKLMTAGYTVHMMLDFRGNIRVRQPQFFEEFCKKWQAGLVK